MPALKNHQPPPSATATLPASAIPAAVPWAAPPPRGRPSWSGLLRLSLVSVPLAVFLESVAENDGWAVVISSQAVHTWPVAWPHYVSAKAAIEALTAVAARQYRRVSFLIVRPPKLATDLTSSPLAFENPLAPETVAEAIVRRLEGARHPGEVELMELSSSGAWALAASGPESPSP